MAQEKENQGVVTFAGNPVTLLGELIKVGDTAPEFTATGEGLKPVRLSDFKGKTVILSVFPSVDTKVCAAQTRRFNKEASELSENVVVLTLSKTCPSRWVASAPPKASTVSTRSRTISTPSSA